MNYPFKHLIRTSATLFTKTDCAPNQWTAYSINPCHGFPLKYMSIRLFTFYLAFDVLFLCFFTVQLNCSILLYSAHWCSIVVLCMALYELQKINFPTSENKLGKTTASPGRRWSVGEGGREGGRAEGQDRGLEQHMSDVVLPFKGWKAQRSLNMNSCCWMR